MRRLVALTVLWIGVGFATPVRGLDLPQPLIKAVFLFNFARFTEWPSSAATGPLTLCVLGDAEVASRLDRLVGDRAINGRDVSVASLATFQIIKSCHLLYIAGDDTVRIGGALDAVSTLPVFTVTDGERFLHARGVATLYTEDGRFRFAINSDAVSRAGLRLSSKVLGLARLVREEPR
jgi:hypothetical protein